MHGTIWSPHIQSARPTRSQCLWLIRNRKSDRSIKREVQARTIHLLNNWRDLVLTNVLEKEVQLKRRQKICTMYSAAHKVVQGHRPWLPRALVPEYLSEKLGYLRPITRVIGTINVWMLLKLGPTFCRFLPYLFHIPDLAFRVTTSQGSESNASHI